LRRGARTAARPPRPREPRSPLPRRLHQRARPRRRRRVSQRGADAPPAARAGPGAARRPRAPGPELVEPGRQRGLCHARRHGRRSRPPPDPAAAGRRRPLPGPLAAPAFALPPQVAERPPGRSRRRAQEDRRRPHRGLGPPGRSSPGDRRLRRQLPARRRRPAGGRDLARPPRRRRREPGGPHLGPCRGRRGRAHPPGGRGLRRAELPHPVSPPSGREDRLPGGGDGGGGNVPGLRRDRPPAPRKRRAADRRGRRRGDRRMKKHQRAAAGLLVLVDVGNTNTIFGVYRGDELVESFRLSTDTERTADEYGALLLPLFTRSGVDPASAEAVVISSVVPPLHLTLERMAQRYFGRKPLFIEPGVRTGMPIRYDNPAEVGADRIVNAVAARERYGSPVVVVDFGTATTFDVVNAAGEYAGGIITPGITISAEALFAHASRLYRVDVRKPSELVGKNTAAAMQAGIYYGYIGLVDGILERLTAELPGLKGIVATGAQAPLIAAGSKYIREEI